MEYFGICGIKNLFMDDLSLSHVDVLITMFIGSALVMTYLSHVDVIITMFIGSALVMTYLSLMLMYLQLYL